MGKPLRNDRSRLLRKIKSLREKAETREESQDDAEKVRETLSEEIDYLRGKVAELQRQQQSPSEETRARGRPAETAAGGPSPPPEPAASSLPRGSAGVPGHGEGEVVALRAELEAARKLEAQVRESRDALDEEIARLRQRSASEVQACRVEVEAVLSRLAETTKTRDFLEAEVRSLRRLSAEEGIALRDELEAARRAQEELTISRESLAADLSEEVRKSAQEQAGLRQEVDSLRRTVERLRQAKDAAEEDIELLRKETESQVGNLKGELGEAHRRVTELQTARDSAERLVEQERREATRERDVLRSRLEEAESRLESLREELGSKRQRKGPDAAKMAIDVAALARLRDENQALQEKVATLEAAAAARREGETGSAGAPPAGAVEDAEQAKALQARVEEMIVRQAEMEEERTSLRTEAREAREREEKAQERLASAVRSAADDKGRILALEEENRERTRTIGDLEKRLGRAGSPPPTEVPPSIHPEKETACTIPAAPVLDPEGDPDPAPRAETPAPGAPPRGETADSIIAALAASRRKEPEPASAEETPAPALPEGEAEAPRTATPAEPDADPAHLEFLFEEGVRPAEFTVDALLQTVRETISHVKEYPAEALSFSYSEDPRSYLRQHCHNVSRLAIFLAWKTGCSEEEIEQVGLAGLIHDAGMGRLPDSIACKHASLTSGALEEIQGHAEVGARIASSLEGIHPVIPEIIRQHHESMDGSGYPNGLQGEGIGRLARILSIVDAYEASAAPRVYHEETLPSQGMSLVVRDVAIVQAADFPPDLTLEELSGPNPCTAMGIVVQRAGTRYDAELTLAFLQNMGFYPLGSLVEIEGGEVAQVVATHDEDAKKPIVQIVTDRNGQRPPRPVYVDLLVNDRMKVARSLPGSPPPHEAS